MYWQISSFPELQHLSAAARKQLIRKSTGRLFHTRLALRSAGIGILLTLLIIPATMKAWKNGYAPQAAELQMLIYASWLMVPSLIFYQIAMIRIRGQLRIYLQQQRQQGEKLPMCLKCGYAVTEDQASCPECGAATR